jgi:hypothetical protein
LYGLADWQFDFLDTRRHFVEGANDNDRLLLRWDDGVGRDRKQNR